MNRYRVFGVLIFGILLAGMASGKSDKLAPYKPFDEPKPKLPNEILSDSRLDKHVKVFVKSKNLQQLFAELSAKTGVKLLTNQKLWGERAIIYFHNRPLRDVMTEVSNLFGYHWSVEGFPGSYRYELFEDSKHARRRDELRKQQAEAKIDLYILYLKKVATGGLDQKAVDKLQADRRYRAFTDPKEKDIAGTLMKAEPFLRKILSSDSFSCLFGDLPVEWQEALSKQRNEWNQEMQNLAAKRGVVLPDLEPFDPSDAVHVKNYTNPHNMPYFYMRVDSNDNWSDMPVLRSPSLDEKNTRAVLGLEPACSIGGDPLLDKPEITVKDMRWIGYFTQGYLPGDILQAMAEQADVDSIADWYFQPTYYRHAVQKIAPDKLVNSMCEEIAYSGQYDGKTLRLRFDKWFVQPLSEEPPASLIERCWKSLEDNAFMTLDVQMEIASLPDSQMHWPGFGLIHGASYAQSSKDGLLFLKALGPELRTIAQSEKGLPASSLMPDQYNQFVQWAATLKPDIPPGDLQQSVITLTYQKIWNDDGGNNYKLILNLPDGSSYPARISVIELEGGSGKGVPEWHHKDLKADVIEVL